jgi:hypothetical protein
VAVLIKNVFFTPILISDLLNSKEFAPLTLQNYHFLFDKTTIQPTISLPLFTCHLSVKYLQALQHGYSYGK